MTKTSEQLFGNALECLELPGGFGQVSLGFLLDFCGVLVGCWPNPGGILGESFGNAGKWLWPSWPNVGGILVLAGCLCEALGH